MSITLLIFTALYIQWTSLKNDTIAGIQGRYFIPLMLLLSLLGRNKMILFNEVKEREIFTAGMILQLVTIIYLIKALIVIA